MKFTDFFTMNTRQFDGKQEKSLGQGYFCYRKTES